VTPPASDAELQQALLGWFDRFARDLPWRRTRDPYRILVSEIMLQQTQVDRVIPKYHAFLQAFPDVETLAAAPTAEVIRLWAGLGYNRRAVNLQRAAQAVVAKYGGQFPHEPHQLQQLPGIGPYTAGAVACFAFEQDVAFMDTNIRRVLLRTGFGPEHAPVPTDRELLTRAEQLLPPGQGWGWNQAIMELGALICTSAAPACRRCPISHACRSYAALRAEDEHLLAAMYGDTNRPPQRRLVAERRTRATSEPFVGSRRYYRGRLLAQLRDLPSGAHLTLQEAGPRIRHDFNSDLLPWLRELAAAMARDGLLILSDDQVRLP
jgi:A/G-specific adenine glycosylase